MLFENKQMKSELFVGETEVNYFDFLLLRRRCCKLKTKQKNCQNRIIVLSSILPPQTVKHQLPVVVAIDQDQAYEQQEEEPQDYK